MDPFSTNICKIPGYLLLTTGTLHGLCFQHTSKLQKILKSGWCMWEGYSWPTMTVDGLLTYLVNTVVFLQSSLRVCPTLLSAQMNLLLHNNPGPDHPSTSHYRKKTKTSVSHQSAFFSTLPPPFKNMGPTVILGPFRERLRSEEKLE